VEVFKNETREILRRFLAGTLSFPKCILALDSAFAGIVPKLTPEHIAAVRALVRANNEVVMKEMERRGPPAAPPLPR
jgi:hypothetical protein